MYSSLKGGLKLQETGVEFDNEKEKKHWVKLFKMIEKGKIEGPDYDYPLDKMPERAMPKSGENIISVKGSCPPPLRACDAKAAQKAGKTCPDPRYAAYPYIQVEETGALCYPNFNNASLQREMQQDKKAMARKSILDLIKVLAAIEDDSGTPGMCNVINSMNSKPAMVREAYCKSLKSGGEGGQEVCSWADSTCSPKSGGGVARASARPPLGLAAQSPFSSQTQAGAQRQAEAQRQVQAQEAQEAQRQAQAQREAE